MVRIDSRELRSYLRASTTVAIVCIFVLFLHGCAGHTSYKPHSEVNSYMETGVASYYATKFQHRKTANGERFDNNAMTAAHKTLPFGTEVIVTNLSNGKSVKVRINDRGPFVKGRIIDLSSIAFSQISNLDKGIEKVDIRVAK